MLLEKARPVAGSVKPQESQSTMAMSFCRVDLNVLLVDVVDDIAGGVYGAEPQGQVARHAHPVVDPYLPGRRGSGTLGRPPVVVLDDGFPGFSWFEGGHGVADDDPALGNGVLGPRDVPGDAEFGSDRVARLILEAAAGQWVRWGSHEMPPAVRLRRWSDLRSQEILLGQADILAGLGLGHGGDGSGQPLD